jgi:hypothetical protein
MDAIGAKMKNWLSLSKFPWLKSGTFWYRAAVLSGLVVISFQLSALDDQVSWAGSEATWAKDSARSARGEAREAAEQSREAAEQSAKTTSKVGDLAIFGVRCR